MRIDVVTPWYPDYAHTYSGVFVEKQVLAIETQGHVAHVDVPLIYPAPRGAVPSWVVDSMKATAISEPESLFLVEGKTTYVPCPVPSGSGPLGRVSSFAFGMSLKRGVLPRERDLTHAHLGIPTGLALLDLGDRPLVITEHQSQLRGLLSDRETARAYAATLQRADAFVCVSSVVKGVIAEFLGPSSVERIEIVPNVVDLTHIPFVNRAGASMSRWLYVGALFAHKGVRTLLHAFHTYLRNYDASATLTIVGEGPMRTWVERFASRRSMSDRVFLSGQLPHREVGVMLAEAHCYVHLSPFETFGIASLEALGSGAPVVSLRNGGAEATWGDIVETCGVLLPRDSSPEEIAGAVAALRSRSDTLDLKAARSYVEQHFSPAVVGDLLTRIYERVTT